MLGLEALVRRVVTELEASTELEDTYIIFTSGHGCHLGEHRLVPVNESRDSKGTAVDLYRPCPLIDAGSALEQRCFLPAILLHVVV